MNGDVLELLQNSIALSTYENLIEYLESCLQHGVFNWQDNAETVIKNINSCLNSSFDKERGLILILAFLPQISVDTFSKNAVSWMFQSNKIIHQKEGVGVLGLRVLAKLIKLSVKFPEVNKDTSKQIVPKFLLDHVRRRSSNQFSLELLECIQACMSAYSGPSGEFKSDILRLVVSRGLVDARKEVVQAAARCVAQAPGLGGGGKQGGGHKTAWRSQQLTLISLLHSSLNLLYQHLDSVMEVEVTTPDDVIKLEPVSGTNILLRTQQLAAQFSSLTHFLRAMLLEEFHVAKSVSPVAILDVIVHAQKPTHSSLGSSQEALAVLSVLPSVLVASTRLLEALVLCLGRNLVPQGNLVCHLCSQVLVWTQQQHSDWPYAMDKPYSEARGEVYNCLHSWLSVAGACSLVHSLPDSVLSSVLSDIHAEKPTVKLKVGPKAEKGKRKQQQTLVSLEDRSEKLGDSVANSSLCERALRTLALMLRTAAPTLKPDTVMRIISTALKLVAELPVPYSDSKCQSALYQLLLTLCLEPHPTVPSPLAPALAAFTAGAHHPHIQVKTTCVSALSSLEKIIHPTAASLHFPLPRETQEPQTRVDLGTLDTEVKQSPIKRRKTEIADDSSSIVSIVLEDSSDRSIGEKTTHQVLDMELSNDSIEVVFNGIVQNSDSNIKDSGTEYTENVFNSQNKNDVVIKEFAKDKVESLAEQMTTSLNETDVRKSANVDDVLPTNLGNIEVLDAKQDNKEEKTETVFSKTENISTETSSVGAFDDADNEVVSQMLKDFNDDINIDDES